MNNSGKGKLIVIEGGDGLGKSTQYSLIEDMLIKEGYEVSTYDFPHKVGNPLSDLIGDFLNGKHGQVEPEFLSLAFAADRYISKDPINGSLESGAIVLCDRYILSNIAFQTSKLIENTNFAGEHWVECYIIKNGICVARDNVSVPI